MVQAGADAVLSLFQLLSSYKTRLDEVFLVVDPFSPDILHRVASLRRCVVLWPSCSGSLPANCHGQADKHGVA